MVFAGIPTDELVHTRAAQDLLDRGRQEGEARGRQEGEAQGEAKVSIRLRNRRCGPLSEATTARIQALPLERLELLADALLDFSGPADLATWLEDHASRGPRADRAAVDEALTSSERPWRQRPKLTRRAPAPAGYERRPAP